MRLRTLSDWNETYVSIQDLRNFLWAELEIAKATKDSATVKVLERLINFLDNGEKINDWSS